MHSSGGHCSFQPECVLVSAPSFLRDRERKELREPFLRGPRPFLSWQSRLLGELSADGTRHTGPCPRSGRSARARVLSKDLIPARNSGRWRRYAATSLCPTAPTPPGLVCHPVLEGPDMGCPGLTPGMVFLLAPAYVAKPPEF